MKNKIIIVSGPTASGKTKTSIEIAKSLQSQGIKTAIVNFDSLLFYREISIGTAKPTQEEQSGIDHYMLDIESVRTPMNASGFIKKCEIIISELLKNDTTVVLVGGSAFYLRALLKGMYESISSTTEIKDKLNTMYSEKGIGPFVEFLKSYDPESLVNLHENDHYRLMRAVEYYELTGTKISDTKKEMDKHNPYDFSEINHPWDLYHIYLDLPKDQHFEIITARVKSMFEQGFMDEVDELLKNGFTMQEKPLRSIGYKEIMEYKAGLFASMDDCIERIAVSTRQLAKSQRTFFNKIVPKESFNPVTDQVKILERVSAFMKD